MNSGRILSDDGGKKRTNRDGRQDEINIQRWKDEMK